MVITPSMQRIMDDGSGTGVAEISKADISVSVNGIQLPESVLYAPAPEILRVRAHSAKVSVPAAEADIQYVAEALRRG